MIDTRLITLITLIDEKNYTKAADRLFITQPSVTHHIKTLEKDYNITIFKDSKNFILSEKGKLLYEYAKSSKNQNDMLINTLNSQIDKKIINVGLTDMAESIINKSFLLEAISDSETKFNLYVDNQESIQEKILNGKFDFGIIDYSFDSQQFESFIVSTNRIVLVCKNDGIYKEKDRITREMLQSASIVLCDENSGLYRATISAIRNKNIRFKNNLMLYASTIDLMLKQVDLNDGIAFVYEDAIKDKLGDKYKKIELLNFEPVQNFYLIYNRISYMNSQARDTIKKIRDYNEE